MCKCPAYNSNDYMPATPQTNPIRHIMRCARPLTRLSAPKSISLSPAWIITDHDSNMLVPERVIMIIICTLTCTTIMCCGRCEARALMAERNLATAEPVLYARSCYMKMKGAHDAHCSQSMHIIQYYKVYYFPSDTYTHTSVERAGNVH